MSSVSRASSTRRTRHVSSTQGISPPFTRSHESRLPASVSSEGSVTVKRLPRPPPALAAERGSERVGARVGLRGHGLDCLAHDRRQLDGLALDSHLARKYRGHVEQVVDEMRERLRVLLYDAHASAGLRLVETARTN